MRLALGSQTYDLDRRALVVGLEDAPGADLVDGAPGGFATAADEAALERALADGACLIRLPVPTPELLERCAAAGASVVIPAGAADDRMVPETLFLDVADDPCPLAAIVAGVVRGARIVRTRHVQVARRVCDVLAAVWTAGG